MGVALESRRRVKEQQRRVFKSEFRNTHFSYILGADGVEQFVATPEQHSDEAIESDPLPLGQVWGVSLATAETDRVSLLTIPFGQGTGLPMKTSAEDSRLLEQSVHRCCDLSALQWFGAPWHPRRAIADRDTAGIRSRQTVQAARRS